MYLIRKIIPNNSISVIYRTDPSNWRDAKVIGNYAYIVSEAPDHGVQVGAAGYSKIQS